MLRAIREIAPVYIVGENVDGIVNWSQGMVFDQVQADLESEGFEVVPVILPACSLNAPHIRYRTWFLAYSASNRRAGQWQGVENENRKPRPEKPGELEGRFKGLVRNGTPSNASGQRLPERVSTGIEIIHNQAKAFQGSEFARTYPKNDWREFPTQSPICSGNDGLPAELSGITFSKHRKESIMAYGNAIVPQVAYQIFKAIEATNTPLP